MRKIVIATVLTILLIAGASAGTYFATKHYYFAKAYNLGKANGYNEGQKEQKKAYSKGYDAGWARERELLGGNSFKSILDTPTPAPPPAPVQVITPPASPQHCSSYTYGIDNQYTSTIVTKTQLRRGL